MKALTGNFRLATTISLAALLTGCAMPQQGGKQILSTNNIYPAVGPYSQMVEHSGTIYLSGVLPLNLAGNAIQGSTIEEQTKAVLEHIGAKLKSQGLTHNDVLMSTVYMKDLNDFAAMNRVYGEYFRTNPPALSLIHI